MRSLTTLGKENPGNFTSLEGQWDSPKLSHTSLGYTHDTNTDCIVILKH